jgi:hypothetical protein
VGRTYSFGGEDLLYEGYTIRGGLAAPRARASEDVSVFEREGNRLLLDERWTRETEICEGAEDERGKEIRERCECLEVGVFSLCGHLASFSQTLRDGKTRKKNNAIMAYEN